MRRLLLSVPASLIALGACCWYWLLHTESGSNWIWARAQSATDGALQAQLLQGDLGSGLTVRQLTFTTDSMTLHIKELRFVADLDLLPLQLQISEAVIDDTAVQVNVSNEESQSSDHRKTIEDLVLPLSLVVQDVRANNISLSGLIPEKEFELTQAELAGSWHEEIVIDRLLINALGSPALTGLSEPVTLQLQAAGNLDQLQIDVTSSPVEMSLRGSVTNLLEALSWDVQAQLAAATLNIGENNTKVHIEDGHAASSGNLNEYLLTATATLDAPHFEPLLFTTTGNGTIDSFEFSELIVRGEDADLSGYGRIVWGDDWSIESRLSVATFDLSTVLEEWPSEHPIQGELSLLLDENHLAISDSYLAAGNTGMSIQVDGKVDLAASIVAASVRWKNAKWPLLGDDPAVSSKSGNISVDGTVDDWRIDGDIEVGTATMPLGQLRVDGNGDRRHVEATIIDSEVLGGNVSGYAAFNWGDQQLWSASVEISGIKLGAFSDDWPDNISGRIVAEGQMSPFVLDLQLSDVDAEFLGGPLSANGQVKLTDDNFTASDLKISHGDTRIELNGDPFALSGLTFDVVVSDASRYLSAANGDFAAAGRVSLHQEQPSLRIEASGAAFGFGEIQATGIEIVDQYDGSRVIDVAITIEELDIHGNSIENVAVGLIADSAAQSLRLDATYGDADVHLFVSGSVDDLKHPTDWQGELRELSLALAGEAIAEQSKPTAISLSEKAVTIDRSCIAANTGMRLCAQADWSADSYLDVGANLTDVPVNLVNSIITTNLQFDQLVSGSFEWSRSMESGTLGNGEIRMSAGTVVSDDDPDVSIVTESSVLSFDIVNGQLHSGLAALSMPGFGHVAAQFSIPDIAEGTNSGINGLVDIDLTDLAVLAALSPFVDAATGEFRADLTLSGTLSEPRLVGDMAVVDGSLTSLPIGLQLDEINLASLLHADGQAELSGDFLAGDGRGEIVTRADYSATGATGFELELRGNNMTLIDAPNVTARADLDIRVNYDFKNLELDGQVLVSHARVNPSNLTVASYSESEDVVIIAGELPDDPLRQLGEQETWISGSVGVEFGDDVSIDLGPATAKLIGKTVFTWEEDLVPIADGRYDLTGSIQAFGQVLEITEGGLRFPQIPADNPFIRIRAEREIYGNVQVKTAGVLVDGTLKQLAVEAYTRPLTTEERALTLLVTGSDFDFEQGLGAIDFGTYIAPRVFVSYGVGLFETENVIRVRYDLNRGFGITATSGEKESGVDLSYRIER